MLLPPQCLYLAAAAAVIATTVAPASRPAVPVTVETDLVYGTGGGQPLHLDLARPAAGNGPFPAVVLIHGGGWTGGSRAEFADVAKQLASHGYVAVTITYRLAPAARFPAQIEDCKAAVRWLRATAAQHHVDPDCIAAAGFSAGGHLAALLGTTSGTSRFAGTGGHADVSSAVQAVIDFSGPTDLTRTNFSPQVAQQCLVPLLGGSPADRADAARAASPVTYVAAGNPPFLIFHGGTDPVVPPDQSDQLLAALKARNVPARLVVYPHDGHAYAPANITDAWRQTLAFLDEHLGR